MSRTKRKRRETQEQAAKPEPQEPRTRQRGDGVRCEKCGGDCFVYNSQVIAAPNRPAFVQRGGTRVRYYKCSQCGWTTQHTTPLAL